jgi:hypothetical protein
MARRLRASGSIPNSHMLFGGDEWWFYGPRVVAGDRIWNERIPFDYTVKETKFGGPTCFQRGDNFYYNQHGDLVAKQRSTSIRYSQAAGQSNTPTDNQDDPVWTDDELEALEERKFSGSDAPRSGPFGALLGHGEGRRRAAGARLRAALDRQLHHRMALLHLHPVGQHASPHRPGHGGARLRQGDGGQGAGPRSREAINPEQTDGAYIGPSRGHLFPRWARFIGMPRGYGYGASMGAWITDYLAGWAGEWGMVRHSTCNYRSPALTGDITIMTGNRSWTVFVDEDGRHMVADRVQDAPTSWARSWRRRRRKSNCPSVPS